jgi:hypothetical protein
MRDAYAAYATRDEIDGRFRQERVGSRGCCEDRKSRVVECGQSRLTRREADGIKTLGISNARG